MKKLLISIISVCCMFLNVFNVSAFEKNKQDISLYGFSYPCPECPTRAMEKWYTDNDYAPNGPYVVPCVHGTGKTDVLIDTGWATYYRCRLCGYSELYDYEIVITKPIRCNGGAAI